MQMRGDKRHFKINNHPEDQTEKCYEDQPDLGAGRVVQERHAWEQQLASEHVSTCAVVR